MLFVGQTDPSPMLDSLSLGSISGVLASTMFVVEVLKRALKGVSGFEKIPTFLYAAAIAVGLSFAANAMGFLPGKPSLVIWSSLISALGSSGFYTWLRNPETVKTSGALGDGGTLEGSSQNRGMIPVLVALVFLSSGCVSSTKRAPNDTPVTNNTRLIYATVLKELATAKQAGLITAAEKDQIEAIRKQFVVALDQMEEVELQGLQVNRATVDKLLDQLIQWRLKADERKALTPRASIKESQWPVAFFTQWSPDSFSGVRDVDAAIAYGRRVQLT